MKTEIKTFKEYLLQNNKHIRESINDSDKEDLFLKEVDRQIILHRDLLEKMKYV